MKKYATGDEKPIKLRRAYKVREFYYCKWVIGITANDTALICGEKFRTLIKLAAHVREKHENKPKPIRTPDAGIQTIIAGVPV